MNSQISRVMGPVSLLFDTRSNPATGTHTPHQHENTRRSRAVQAFCFLLLHTRSGLRAGAHMISAFAEAVRETTQPCSWLLIAPSLLAVIATRGRWTTLVAAVLGAIVGGWLFMANVVALSDNQLRVSGLIAAGAILLLIAAPRSRWLRWGANIRVQSAVTAGLSFLGTLWWRPCVGEELGVILTGAAQDGLAGELLGMAGYMAGAMVPVVIVGLVLRAAAPSPHRPTWLTAGDAILAVLLGGALALGLYDDLVRTLTSWSQ